MAHASPWENIHDKVIIDATSMAEGDPIRPFESEGVADSLSVTASAIEGVVQARMLRPSMMVITTDIGIGRGLEESIEEADEPLASHQREVVGRIISSIWKLESSKDLRWLFITDSDADLEEEGWKRRLLWQLFCRFDGGWDLHFDETGGRGAWDATVPVPSDKGPLPVRRWPAVTLHDPELVQRVDEWLSQRL